MYTYYRVARDTKLDEELKEFKLWSGEKTDSKALKMLAHFGYKWFFEENVK
jgi:hypothetical protein